MIAPIRITEGTAKALSCLSKHLNLVTIRIEHKSQPASLIEPWPGSPRMLPHGPVVDPVDLLAGRYFKADAVKSREMISRGKPFDEDDPDVAILFP